MSKRRKIILIIIGILAIIGIVALFMTGGVKVSQNSGTTDTESSPSETVEVNQIPSLVEEETGQEQVGEEYQPTPEEVAAQLEPLIGFDTNTQTYDEWHDFAAEHIIYTPQDFPEDSVTPITPSRERWNEGWKREFTSGKIEPIGTFTGQGGAKVYEYSVSGFQTLYDGSGEPWIGSQNQVDLAVQCGNSPDSCFFLGFSGTYPILFEEEEALYVP